MNCFYCSKKGKENLLKKPLGSLPQILLVIRIIWARGAQYRVDGLVTVMNVCGYLLNTALAFL